MGDATHKLVEHTTIRQAGLDERWLQQQIAENPTLLGLGKVFVRDKERRQPKAGRLDLLLENTEEQRRYVTEIQLGATDEAHIIRAIEYWDIERRRYPQYDHCAVLVSEDVTSRFLNVITLLGGQVPLIAIKLQAIKMNGGVGLLFVRVVDELARGAEEEDGVPHQPTDRKTWEKRLSREMIDLGDRIFGMAREVVPGVEINYLQHYWGVQLGGKSNNFFSISPRKGHWVMSIRLTKSIELDTLLETRELRVAGYTDWGAYDLRVGTDDVSERADLLKDLLRQAYAEWIG